MSSVVPFARPAPVEAPANDEPHISGRAKCLACAHTWAGVAPVGTTGLECPSCGCMRGVWQYPCVPSGGLVFVCNCDNDLYHLTPTGAMCVNCGIMPRDWQTT